MTMLLILALNSFAMLVTPPPLNELSRVGFTLAHWAALNDSLELAGTLAADHQALTATDPYGHRPLHFARSEAMARFLISVDPKGLEERDHHGNLPLHVWAASHGPAMVALNKFCSQWRPFWIENPVNAVNVEGRSAMSLAIQANDLDLVSQLLECQTFNTHRANPQTHLTILHEAAILGRTEIVEKILSSGRGIDVIFVDMLDPSDLTANALALLNHHPETSAVLRHWRATLANF